MSDSRRPTVEIHHIYSITLLYHYKYYMASWQCPIGYNHFWLVLWKMVALQERHLVTDSETQKVNSRRCKLEETADHHQCTGE